MFVRAVLAFLALPGLVAFAVPVVWLNVRNHTQLVEPAGLLPLVGGSLALLWCARDFYVAGKGTLAPWAPPKRLVVVGLYRHTRNPMYVAVMLILVGWGAAFGCPAMYGYALGVAIAFHLRVVRGEEPWLARKHGAAWEDYKRRVPRWLL
jgi:protein-S-isoprenylcysteine O-methyltransferase Ste14